MTPKEREEAFTAITQGILQSNELSADGKAHAVIAISLVEHLFSLLERLVEQNDVRLGAKPLSELRLGG